MNRRLLVAVVLAAIAAQGCGAESDGAAGDPWLELGMGQDDFAPLSDGGDVPITVGAQGGDMLVLAIRASGIYPGDPSTNTTESRPRIDMRAARAGDGAVVATRQLKRLLEPAGGGVYTASGLWLVFRGTLDRADYVDRELVVEASILDRDGITAAFTLHLTPRL